MVASNASSGALKVAAGALTGSGCKVSYTDLVLLQAMVLKTQGTAQQIAALLVLDCQRLQTPLLHLVSPDCLAPLACHSAPVACLSQQNLMPVLPAVLESDLSLHSQLQPAVAAVAQAAAAVHDSTSNSNLKLNQLLEAPSGDRRWG